MRIMIAVAAFAAVLVAAGAAQAERRIFIIANNSDGYGIDRCLASGAKCGAPAAATICEARGFMRALSWRKVSRHEITGGIPQDAFACGGRCDEFVAIECTR